MSKQQASAWVEEHGDALFRYALKHVRDRDVAQDLVQDAFLAAWQARQEFAGRSALRTWLIGILRHKVLDHFRRVGREGPLNDPTLFDIAAEATLFDAAGHWVAAPGYWGGDPEQALTDKALQAAFEDCLSHLPPTMARAFVLRSLEECDIDDACKTLQVTSTNLYVLLYRARMRLRECLEQNWYQAKASE